MSPYAEEQGGAVLCTTIDKHAYVSLRTREDGCYQIWDMDDDLKVSGRVDDGLTYDGRHDLAKSVIKRLDIRQGFDLTLHSDAPWGSGLGSSSTHIVAVLGAFAHRLQLRLTNYELAEMAYDLERKDIGQAGGRQDQYAATFGGINFIEYGGNGTVVSPLRVSPDILLELHYRLLLCFLGRTRISAKILEDQINRYRTRESESVDALHRTKELAYEMKRALLKGEIDRMGEILHEGWEQKRHFSDLISDSHIDEIYEDALQHGAVGGKLLGAGGGGHMLFLCSPEGKYRLAKHLTARAITCVGFAFEPNGMTVWEVADGQ